MHDDRGLRLGCWGIVNERVRVVPHSRLLKSEPYERLRSAGRSVSA